MLLMFCVDRHTGTVEVSALTGAVLSSSCPQITYMPPLQQLAMDQSSLLQWNMLHSL